ncbi:MAG: ribosome biogenesis GTPase Der [Acidobacteriota bacterium]|nr:ribosome biogenesis GTPase Der [Acidobacteriota bacterium]
MASRGEERPTVVLVGRPNVGKSTLFNKITGTRRSIVAPVAGTTRDVIAQSADWRGREFTLVDTGGMFGATTDPLHELVIHHGRKALDSASIIVFVTDGREGLVPGDEAIAHAARLAGTPVVLAVNKTDDKRSTHRALEFHRLGFDTIVEIAAEHGNGIGDLLDEVIARLPSPRKPGETEPDVPEEPTSIAIVGRPNAGKSSLLNRLLNEDRVMVNAMPGTTRDAIDVELQWNQKTFKLVDTAGIRKAGKVHKSGLVENVSVVIAKRAIARADVALLVIDALEGPADQDGAIAGEAERTGCGIVIVANKWDLMKGRGPEYVKDFDESLRRELKFLDYAPVLHISALTGERSGKVLETADRVAASRKTRVTTGELNRFIKVVTEAHPPVAPGARGEVRIMYAVQSGVAPPEFVFFTNIATKLHFSYERFLVNRLRESFKFEGTPIRIVVRKSGAASR